MQFQADCVRDLIEATDYPTSDLDEGVRIFLTWKQGNKEDILTCRDASLRSVMTGAAAAEHRTA